MPDSIEAIGALLQSCRHAEAPLTTLLQLSPLALQLTNSSARVHAQLSWILQDGTASPAVQTVVQLLSGDPVRALVILVSCLSLYPCVSVLLCMSCPIATLMQL